jgi:CBS domain-containing membrane protein
MNGRLVRDVMTRAVVTVGPNDKLATAADVMRLGRIRHLPVLDDGEICGLVSQRDLFHSALLKALGYGGHGAQKAREMFLVKEAMTTDIHTTSPDTPLGDAAGVMLERKIGCLPVVEEGKLVGILTESDFVSLYRTAG